MKAVKRSLLLLLCVAMLVAGALVMSACSKECTEHEWGNWTVTTAATCIAEGTETRTCNACGETETRAINKTAHTFSEYVADGNATCMADGTKTATCTTAGCTAKDTVADAGSKKEHSFTNYTSNGDATCQADGTKTATCDFEGCNETETVTDVGSKKNHTFTTYHSDNNATCQADGTKTATCDWYGCDAKDTVTDTGSKKSHSFTNYISNGDATCVLDGTKTATCDFKGCNETETIEDEGSKLGHLWNAELTCTTGHECTRQGCDAEEAALGHNYTVVGGTELTCEQDSTTVYACQNGCNDTFTVTNAVATGHSVDEWTFDSESFLSECTYELTYVGTCQNPGCGETVTKTEQTERHTLTSTIHTGDDATCTTPGRKHITCTECDYETYENYTNSEAHVWGVKSKDGNVTTYECSECHITKTAITATEDTEATVDKSTLESVGEVELKDANIKLDESTLGGLEGDVSISAGTLEGDELNAVKDTLDTDKLDQIGNNPIYNFGLSDSNGAVSSFDGWVTIRVPYELQEGDDVDSIAVWFINDSGEVESIQAVYDNGYAVFSTNHFSYYTVTRLTPAERCALYGHSYKETVVTASCISDGYVLKVCQRCGHSSKEITGKATGHSITTTTVAASCTESGTATHSCENCDYERVEKIAPTGHSWAATDTLEATCKAAGYTVYTCSTCSESYKTVIAQKAHSYVDTVTKATCTADGYTTRVCEWCEYTVITGKTAALGHDYKTSTVASGCTTEGYTLHECSRCDASYKTDIVPASHTWDIEAPTCGKGQTCIVCGKGGLSATGNHTMVDGVCSVCGTGCKHNYNSVVTAPTCTEVGFTTNTCTLCGIVEKTDYKPATGHTGALNCTVCGAATIPADFYTNILASFLNEQYTILIDSLMVEDNMYIVNSELYVSLKGGISGWGTVNIRAFGTTATFRAIIEDEVVYLCGENTIALTDTEDVYGKIPFAKLLSEATDAPAAVQMIASLATNENVLNWVSDTLLPFAMNLVADGKDEANLIAKTVVELICNVEVVDDNVVITPSVDKIKALNERLATETIGEFIDTEFGAGTYDDVVEKIDSLFDLTIGDIIDGAKENGADVIALIDSLDALVATIVGENVTLSQLMELETSIQDMLKDEELRAVTIEQLVSMLAENMGGANKPQPEPDENTPGKPDYGYGENEEIIIKPINPKSTTTEDGTVTEPEVEAPSIRAQLAQMLAQVKNATLYQMMGADVDAEEAIKIVNDSIDTVFGELTVSIKTDKNGTLIALDVAYGEMLDASIVADYTSTNDYSQVKADAEKNTDFKTSEDYLEGTYGDKYLDGEYLFEIDKDGKLVGLWYTRINKNSYNYGSETDDEGNRVEIVVVQMEINEYNLDLTDAFIITHGDCGDWLGVMMAALGTRTYTHKTVVEKHVNGELVETIDDPKILELLGFGSKGESYTETYMDDVEFFINTKTGEIKSFGNAYTLHEWEEDEAKLKPAVGCEGVGEKHYFCTVCGDTTVIPYTNGHTNQRVYELKEGATSCEDGVIVKNVCTVCGKVSDQYEADWHAYSYENVDLSGYGICEHHRLEKYSCACGKESGFYINSEGLEWTEGNSRQCNKCGLTVNETSVYTPGEGCMMNEVRNIVISKDGSTIYSETINRTYESHNTREEVTLLPGSTSCEDGILVKWVCSKCGKVESEYEEYYHREYEKIVADFSDYGSVCGGYIYSYGCACGYYDDKEWVGVSTDCEFEQTTEYWNEWCDYLEKYTCAVTSPACGFTYYKHAYVTETDCGRTFYEEYYVMKNGEKVVLYSFITRDDVYHSYEASSESATPVNELSCFYLVSRVEKCTVCGHDNVFEGYEFQHSYAEHSDGYYCDVCGEGEHYEYDDQDRVIAGTYIRWYTDGTNSVSYECEEWRWIYREGYRFIAFNGNTNNYYSLKDGKWEMTDSSWHRNTYEYDFSGVCTVTRTFENSYGKDNYTDTYCACEYFNYSASTDSTCTQHGIGNRTCVICGTSSTYDIDPICHDWIWYIDGECYACRICGLKNANGASGGIVLEDASDLDDDDDTYIVGYYYRDFGDKFEIVYAITLVDEYGNELAFIDLDEHGIIIAPWGTGRYITFSKSAVMNAAKKLGYTEDQYDIRISFVPVGWENDLDYAVTFEVMSATDECAHYYSKNVCIFCGAKNDSGNVEDGNCKHYYEGGKCVYCGQPEYDYVCKHEYDQYGNCIYCGEYNSDYDGSGEIPEEKIALYTYNSKELSLTLYSDYTSYYSGIIYTDDGMAIRTEGEGGWDWYHDGRILAHVEGVPYEFTVSESGELTLYEGSVDYPDDEICKHEYDQYGNCIYCGEYNSDYDGSGEIPEEKIALYTYNSKELSLTLYSDYTSYYSGIIYTDDGMAIRTEGEGGWDWYHDGRILAHVEGVPYEFTVSESGELTLYEGSVDYPDDEICKHEFVDGWCIWCNAVDENYATTCNHEDYDMNGQCDKCLEYIGVEEGCAHSNVKTEGADPTCTDAGFRTTYCGDCGTILDSYELAPYGHTFENGYCVICREAESTGEDEKKEVLYTYNDKVTIYFYNDYTTYYTGRVYTADGMVYEVENYGEWYMLAETGMIYTWVEDVEYAFVLVDGTLELYVEGGEETECKHEETYTESFAASCTDYGYERIYCAKCNYMLGDTITGSPLGHNYVDGQCEYCGQPEYTYDDDVVFPKDVLFTYNEHGERLDDNGKVVYIEYYSFIFYADETALYEASAQDVQTGEEQHFSFNGQWKEAPVGDNGEKGIWAAFNLDGEELEISFVFDEYGNLVIYG